MSYLSIYHLIIYLYKTDNHQNKKILRPSAFRLPLPSRGFPAEPLAVRATGYLDTER